MEELSGFLSLDFSRQQMLEQLASCNDVSTRYGLELSAQDMQILLEQRARSLQASGRIEFGEGILPRLVYAFCDSPYITPQNYVETLCELQDSFYYFKSEGADTVADDELVDLMRRYFDGPCQGSLDYLNSTTLDELCRDIRNGEDQRDKLDNWRWNL